MKHLHLEELPYSLDSCRIFDRLRDLALPVFLDSAAPYSQRGRYDIITAEPREKIILNTLKTKRCSTELNIFRDLKDILKSYNTALENDYKLPFIGGAIGYFGYDVGRQLETLPEIAERDLDCPDALIGLYDWAVIVDHHNRRSLLMAHPQAQTSLISEIRHRLRDQSQSQEQDFQLLANFQSNLSKEQYRSAFLRTQQFIRSGDCYQINLAQRFSTEYKGSPWQAYRQLREVAAAPFSAYMQHGDLALMCLSPERFLKVDGNRIKTSPIKGTIGRGINAEKDQLLAKQLLSSEKDRAENLMIVDLLRNDLGRSCKPGSITVDQLFELQSFETVHHLVSTISGELNEDQQALDVLAACFPGGSITGAPKVRAMEIIEELEPQRRSAYCGAIGYISYDGQMDTNIAIRTFLCDNNNIHCWAGGGIVADSDCDAEYQECLSKVERFLKTLEASSKDKEHSPLQS